MKKILNIVLLVIVGVTLIGCSATPTKRAFKEGWRDSAITSKVKWRLGRDKLVRAHNINVDTWRGVVTLNGRTTSEEEKSKAEQIASGVKSVKGVRNYIDIVGLDSVPQKVVKENVPFSKPKGKFARTEDITLPAVNAAPAPLKEEIVQETGTEHKPATMHTTKKGNSVSREIDKVLSSSDEPTAPAENDVTTQAHQELQELKTKKGR